MLACAVISRQDKISTRSATKLSDLNQLNLVALTDLLTGMAHTA